MTATPAAEFLSATKDGVLTLTLNRPEALNALTGPMLKGLTDAVTKAGRDKAARVVVLAAAGRAFSAGADLGDVRKRLADGTFEHGEELRKTFNPLILAIRRVEKPVVAVVQGTAAGAGASLALACDLKICSAEAKFINAFSKVGLIPDSGMTWMLPRALGLSLALEHAWLGRPIASGEALRFGLVNRVVPAADLASAAAETAAALLAVPPLALALTKRALNRSLEAPSLEDQLETEAQLQSFLGRTKDHAEGVASFLEKRAPKFTGE
ncbi:MAG TPA: enoyl-CoA hydratase-related protein [Elusimicrobiota bacterium]|jgi:2-(1,2-epoxy-1,2-dihydrophenyl)acetyl-CoA isomerase|nr:enoyl-CoA hydratase-related protein [Elusimicrobiota bacterium]